MRNIIFTVVFGGILLVFLIVNIYASQANPTPSRTIMAQDSAGGTAMKPLNRETVDQEITHFKDLLKLNPKSRDVLYKLSLLYKEKGDRAEASKYLKQAQEIDPWLSNVR